MKTIDIAGIKTSSLVLGTDYFGSALSAEDSFRLMDAYYAGIVLYPEAFADVDMATIGGEILEFMLGENFFAEMEAGGLYYGKLTIGQ